jgi:hypothetical protein
VNAKQLPNLPEVEYAVQLGAGPLHGIKVEYDLSIQRDEIFENLTDALTGWKLVPVSFQDLDLDLRNLTGKFVENLEALAKRNAARKCIDAVLLLDWEKRIDPDLPGDRQPPSSLLAVFNLVRELFERAFGCPVIVFTNRRAMDVIQRVAIDLSSWFIGPIDFPCDPARVEVMLRDPLEAAQNIPRGQERDVLGGVESNLDDAEGLHRIRPVPDLVARYDSRLAELYLQAGDPTRAGVYSERLARRADSHDLKEWSQSARGVNLAPPRSTLDQDLAWTVFRSAAALRVGDPILGREDNLKDLLEMLLAPGLSLGVLCSETGCGKTSLVCAGLIPALENQGYLPLYVKRYVDPLAELRAVAAERQALPLPPLEISSPASMSRGETKSRRSF